jgi:hypothetical protein
MFVAAAAFGHAIHTGIWLLQGQVEEWSTELFLELFAGKADPFRERTRIGDLGRIKLSDRILMRVEPEGARPASILLRESAFEAYRNGEWRSLRPTPRAAARDGDRWTLSEEPATGRLTVRRSIAGGEGLLALPAGARSVELLYRPPGLVAGLAVSALCIPLAMGLAWWTSPSRRPAAGARA